MLSKQGTRKKLCGAALIEVLVSMLLSAVALLALAGVNAAALRLGKMSQHRAHATLLALDLAERVRANPVGAGAGHYGFHADWASQSAAPAPTAQCQASVSFCGAAEMAALDVAQWRWHVRALLPQGAVLVQNHPQGAATERVDIWIAWQEPSSAAVVPSAPGGSGSAGDPNASPAAAGECPDSLGVPLSTGVRCSHLRVHL